jgi:hypothetical protein
MKANTLLYMTVVLLLVISVIFFTLGSSPLSSSLDKRINDLSYSLGLQIGRNLAAHSIEINMVMFLSGLDAGRHGQAPLLTNKQVSQSTQILMTIMGCQESESNAEAQSYDDFMKNKLSPDNEMMNRGIFEY